MNKKHIWQILISLFRTYCRGFCKKKALQMISSQIKAIFLAWLSSFIWLQPTSVQRPFYRNLALVCACSHYYVSGWCKYNLTYCIMFNLKPDLKRKKNEMKKKKINSRLITVKSISLRLSNPNLYQRIVINCICLLTPF